MEGTIWDTQCLPSKSPTTEDRGIQHIPWVASSCSSRGGRFLGSIIRIGPDVFPFFLENSAVSFELAGHLNFSMFWLDFRDWRRWLFQNIQTIPCGLKSESPILNEVTFWIHFSGADNHPRVSAEP